MRRATLSTMFLVLVLAISPASAADATRPTFRAETVYFHCSGQTKMYQANWGASVGSYAVPWNTTAPAESVQAGAGCGGADWGGTSNPAYDPVFRGDVTGNLSSVTVRIHSLVTGNARQTATESLRVWGDVDGVPIFPAAGRKVTVTPVRVNSGATDLYEFTITNLGFYEEGVDEAGNAYTRSGGLATEPGDGTNVHTLSLGIGLDGVAFGTDPASYKATAWVWDTTEVPAGLTFNPAAPAAATVAADLPVFE
jgi:hypothetical protein